MPRVSDSAPKVPDEAAREPALEPSPISRSPNLVGHRMLCQKVNVRRDSLEFRRIEHPAPAVHPRIRHSLADHGENLLRTSPCFH